MHAVATKESIPVAIAIGPGNQHEGKELIAMMESIRIEHPEGKRGRPRKRPKRVYADNKYGMHINRFYLQQILSGCEEGQLTHTQQGKEETSGKTKTIRQGQLQENQTDD